MWRVIVLTAVILCVTQRVSLGQDSYAELKLKDGRQLKNVVVKEVLADGLKVSHSDGGGRLGADVLPTDIVTKYKLDTPEVEKALLLRKEKEQLTPQPNVLKVDTYDLVYKDLKLTLNERATTLRKKLVAAGATARECEAFDDRQKSRYDAWLAAVKEADATGISPSKCRRWIASAMDDKPIVGMTLSFVYLAWGKPQLVRSYHLNAMQEHVYGNNYVHTIKDIVIRVIIDEKPAESP